MASVQYNIVHYGYNKSLNYSMAVYGLAVNCHCNHATVYRSDRPLYSTVFLIRRLDDQKLDRAL